MAKADAVFLDSSVIIAALLSPTGGSSAVIRNHQDRYKLLINEFVFAEIHDVLANKFSGQLSLESDFYGLLAVGSIDILAQEIVKAVRRLEAVIETDDAPILAGALARADFLLSLDNHFLNKGVRDYARKRGLAIFSPGEFLTTTARGL